jgi:hypothetical protein
MKRSLLAAAVAALFAPAGLDLWAAEPAEPPQPAGSRYTINDAGYLKGTGNAIKSDASTRSVVVPAGTKVAANNY